MEKDIEHCQFKNEDDLLNCIVDLYYDNRNYRLGKVLTVIDGCISDTIQRKAIKDLIHNAFGFDKGLLEKDFFIGEIEKEIRYFLLRYQGVG